MKKAYSNRKDILKGVSTLDEFYGGARIALLLLIIIVFGGSLRAGHSVLDRVDPSFNPQIQANSFGTKQITSIVCLSDGKILVGGNFNSYNRLTTGKLVRLNADGTLDAAFSNTLLASGLVQKIMLQADGKIVVRGSDLLLTGQTAPGKPLIRLNADGTLDTTFNYTESGSIADMTVDASGRILLSGLFPADAPTRKGIRLNADGSVDPSFQYGSSILSERIAAQNNKWIIAGLIGSQPTMQRLNEDGSIDASFTQRNLVVHSAMPLVQPDGKILVLELNKLQRFNENGSDDTGFTPTAFPGNTARTMALGSDGRITLSYGSSPTQITRFLSNGAADGSFTPYGATSYSTFGLQPDGGVIIGDLLIGGNMPLQNHFVRLFPNGSPDTTFNAGGIGFQNISPGSIRAITVLPDGKIMIGGKFDAVNDVLRFKIARIKTDSTLDTTFQVALGGPGNTFSQILDIFNITAQPDGKLLVSGIFTYTVNGASKSNFVRLNTDGSIDPTFVLNVILNDTFLCCGGGKTKSVFLSDGKIMVGASRRTSTEVVVPVKLNSDGTRDTSFAPTIFADRDAVFIHDLAVQPDGKIIIGGEHLAFPDPDKSFVARLNPDGTTDPTFQISEETDKAVAALALQPNGKILIVIGNYFGAPVQQSNVRRLNADGSPDNTFNAGTSANGRINTILLLSNGKMFVGGKFTSFNGQPRQNLAQLNADGSLSPVIYNLNDEVLSLAVDADGRVLVGGRFTIIAVGIGSVGTASNRTYLARLVDSGLTRTRFDFDGDRKADVGIFSSLNKTWSILHSQTNQPVTTQFGLGADKIAPADFDGDGKADIAVYRPWEGNWYMLRSTAGFVVVRFGANGDKPVPADYDGDKKADIAVWRPGTGDWWILQSSNGETKSVHFGAMGDVPLPDVDFDGDGKADIAVWRGSEGNFYWLASASADGFRVVHFGQEWDIPAPADYNGDGKADLVVFRPSEGNWYQNLSTASGNYTFAVTNFGLKGDEPVAADYNGDGKTDIAVRRNGVWHLLLSGQGYSVVTFGNPGAQAIAALPAEVTISATEDLPEK